MVSNASETETRATKDTGSGETFVTASNSAQTEIQKGKDL